MSIVAFSNADDDDEPPPITNQPPPSSPPPSLFSSLPEDLILNIVTRVPKRYYPIVACVCKNLANLVRSREIQTTRSLRGLDSLYISFFYKTNGVVTTYWFTFRKIKNNANLSVFDSIRSIYHPDLFGTSAVAIGPEIFFLGPGIVNHSSTLWIFDSRSGKFREGPNMLVKRVFKNSVGLIGGKIYVIGGCNDQIPAESFDLKKQIWEVALAPVPVANDFLFLRWRSYRTVSLDRKLYALTSFDGMTCYDPRDGSCVRFELPNDKWWRTGVCVIENVLYVYYARFGLMWFDTKLVRWRVVFGLRHLNKVPLDVGMAEYYGQLAFLWQERRDFESETKEIWCRMIGLDKSEVGIIGTEEPAQHLGSVPRGYILDHCISVSD